MTEAKTTLGPASGPDPDVLILGAGPAGTGAALAAAGCGLRTLIVDAAAGSGGQVYRAVATEFQSNDDSRQTVEQRTGAEQRRALGASDVATAYRHQVWSVGQDFRVDALGPHGPVHWRPRALIVATGASERVIPFPGWTLPGVIGLAAATILLKSQQLLPGRRTLVAGCGPLLAAVAYGILKGGGEVAAVVDLAGRRDWLAAAPPLLARPAELRRGLGWRRALHHAGVPWLYRHSIRAVNADADDLSVTIGAVAADGTPIGTPTRRFEVDCVSVGHGLIPATDITRLLRAEHVYRHAAGGWIPKLDDDQRSSRPGLYAAGDGCGIRGAAAAHQAGYIAGYAAALDLGHIDKQRFRRLSAVHRRALRRGARLGDAMATLMAQRPGQIAAIAGDTVVCRCEEITRGEIEQALDGGASDIQQIKSWTRCGMGPCQGRICGDSVAALAAARLGGRERAGCWSARVPLRPLDLAAYTGDYDYADIGIPTAAPL